MNTETELSSTRWDWPLDLERYDRNPALTKRERMALDALMAHFATGKQRWLPHTAQDLARVLLPLYDVLDYLRVESSIHRRAIHIMLRALHYHRTSFWMWSWTDWRAVLLHAQVRVDPSDTQVLMGFCYLLAHFDRLHELGQLRQTHFARKIFGAALEQTAQQIWEKLLAWGYGKGTANRHNIWNVVSTLALVNHSPLLSAVTRERLVVMTEEYLPAYLKPTAIRVSRALVALGCLSAPLPPLPHPKDSPSPHLLTRVHPDWADWAARWKATSILTKVTRQGIYYELLKTGRWLHDTHPDIHSPSQWTFELAIEYNAAVERMQTGDFSLSLHPFAAQPGKPYSAKTKLSHLSALRTFFRDCQEWQWIPRQFSPDRCFRGGRDTQAQIRTNPRVIADDLWAKLLWAGLNLTEADVSYATYTAEVYTFYPFAMQRALAVTWLFAGLRCDEIRRLTVGCIRWQHNTADETGVCLLDVPVNKTGPAFTKPVSAVVGQAIQLWEAERPSQPRRLDRKTAHWVDALFVYRGKAIGQAYLNESLIPLLCRKANVPLNDARGRITSHRARSTIASQLANAREPMSLLELQQWLGHHSPKSTQHYVRITPTTLTRAYSEAGYFDRNLRTIQVLLDRDAVGTSEPWLFYDLGHGYCTYDFFDQCPHRMACARCAFYRPKGSAKAQLLEARTNLARMSQQIPLTDEERAAVDDGLEAMEQLLKQLQDTPTPTGVTPRQMQVGFVPLAALTVSPPNADAVLDSGTDST